MNALRRTWRWWLVRVFAAVVLLPIGVADAAKTKTDKVATWTVKNDNNVAAKAYAVFVDVGPNNIDLAKTKGGILKMVRLEPRYGIGNPKPLIGTLVVFEDETGIPKGKDDKIELHFKDLPRFKKDVKFSNISTLRSATGPTGGVIEQEVPRIGFKVDKDPIYNILNFNVDPFSPDPENPDPFPIEISGLEYLSNVPEVVDTTPFLDLGNSYGFTPLGLDPLIVSGNSESVDIDIPGPVDFGNWLYVRGLMTITHRDVMGGFVTSEIPFVHGQTEYVPEPGSVVLLCGAWCGAAFVRRRTEGRSKRCLSQRRRDAETQRGD